MTPREDQPPEPAPSSPNDFLQGGGETGALMRARDWAATDLGPVAGWSPVLRGLVGAILHQRAATAVLWGEHLVQLYNDGYRDILQGRHPRALGERASETWRAEWPQLGPVHDAVLRGGQSLSFVGQPLLLTRKGFVEETCFDLSYSPIPDLAGGRAGVLVSLVETTAQMLGARRLQTLQRLTRDSSHARTVREAARLAVEALGHNPRDLPFVLLYLRDHEGAAPARVAASGVAASFHAPAGWWEALPERVRVRASKLPVGLQDELARREGPPCECVLRLPLEGPTRESFDGFLVVGLSAQLDFDAGYADFVGLVASQCSGALAHAWARGGGAVASADRDQLAHMRDRLSDVLESVSDAFYVLDREWRFVLVNASHERMTHTPRSAMLGRVVWELFPFAAAPTSPYWLEYHRCMEERTPGQFVAYYEPLNTWTEVRTYPTTEGIAVVARDVSEGKQAEVARQRQATFEQQLIGIVSHDLRNPLNAILLGATLLARREELDGPSTKAVLRIQSSAERATRLVRDLLDFTQARMGGGIPVARQPIDLHPVLRAVLDEVEASHPGRELRVRFEGDGRGAWDADRLAQVVQNLVTNALKYSPDGTPVEVETRGEPGAVTLRVRNQGTPIPAARLAHLFEPMQRLSADLDHASRSVGLGLYIVQQIVDAHGGTVGVESSADAGTTFTVRLPRAAS